MQTRRSTPSIPRTLSLLTLPLLVLSGCADPSMTDLEADTDADAAPETSPDDEDEVDAPQSGLPAALERAGVAPFTAQGELRDPPAPAPDLGVVPPRPAEGDYVLVRGLRGATWVPYSINGDDVMVGDDVVLGTVAEVLGASLDADAPVARSLGESSLSQRWPNQIVYYELDVNVGPANTNIINQALNNLEAVLPLRFVQNSNAPDRVHFVLWGNSFGLSEGIGMSGGVQKIKLQQTTNAPTVVHEVLHALGLFHEQQRPDRDNFVDYHPECVNPGSEGNFTKFVSELHLGPYDLASLMHYRGTSQCATDLNNACICPTLTYAGTDTPVVSPNNGCDQNADPLCFLSDLDIAAIWTMYGDFRADVVTANDYLGWATAAGDFDGDGLDDIASSAVLANNWQGKVMTFKGSYGINDGMWAAIDPGLVPWRALRRSAFATPAVSDLFGMSLVAADFDGDGLDDLAVGAPGAGGHGAVYVYRGSRGGLVPDVELNAGTGFGNSRFDGADYGSALAAADLDGDGVPELIVGAPGDRPNNSSNACGGIYTYRLNGAPSLLARWNPSGAQCQADAEAGASVAGTAMNGAEGKLIVVGAPGADSDRGRAWVLEYANVALLSTSAHLTQSSAQTCVPGGVLANNRAVGDRFGAAVAAGTRANNQHIIAIGSPGENQSSGQVDTFRFNVSCWARENPLTQSPLGVDEPGDQFGAALAIGNLTGDSYGDLLVGAPGEASGAVTAGWMYTFRGTYSAFAPHQGFGQSTGGWTNGNGERFGQSFALAEVDGNIVDLVVGAPGNNVSGTNYAGSLFIMQGQGNNQLTGWRSLDMDSKSPYAD